MLLIIIGIVLAILGVAFLLKTKLEFVGDIVVILGIIVLLIGMFIPLSGYEEFKLKSKTKLLPIKGMSVEFKEEQDIYVVDSNQDIYFVCVQIPKEGILKQKTTYEAADTKIVYGDEFVIKEYVASGKKSIWTLALFSKNTRYEICVPEENVISIIY